MGPGLEYAHSRPFEVGDEVKNMDWRVTARKGRHYVKDYEALKQMPVYLLVDSSASMVYRSTDVSKYGLALQLAGALGISFQSHLNPVGLITGGERKELFQPSLSRRRLFQWLNQIRTVDFTEGTALAKRLSELPVFVRKRCLVVILSDLHDEGLEEAISRIHQEHDLIIIHIQDPAEHGKLKAGFFRGREAETGRTFVGHGRSSWLSQSLHDGMASHGIDYFHIRTDREFHQELQMFLVNRDRRKRS